MARIRTVALITAALAVASASAVVGSAPAFAAAPGAVSPACSGQIWNPGNNSKVDGNASWNAEIFKANSAQSCGVGWTTSYYQAGDWITIHCVWSNSAGQTWFYIHDNETGKTGWLAGSNVSPGADNYGKC